jgi:hypothetical protein
VATLSSIAQGIHSSVALNHAQKNGATLRAGANSHFLIVVSNLVETTCCINLVNQAFHSLQWGPLSLRIKVLVYATPVLLTLEVMKHVLPDEIHSKAAFLYNHLSDIYQLASVVSSVAVLFFGHTMIGAASLCILGIGVLDQHGIIPHEWRQKWQVYPIYVALVLNLLRAENIFKSVAWTGSFFLIEYLMKYQPALLGFDTQHRMGGGITLRPTELTKGMLSETTYSLSINPSYLYYRPMLEVPAFDLKGMIDQFNEITWEGDNLVVLRKKLVVDERFREKHRNPELVSDDVMIEFVRENFYEFINSVREKKILVGEPVNHGRLESYLKIIGNHLETQDSMTRTDALLRLAIEGGRYCGPGRFEAAESVYMSVSGQSSDSLPLVDVIADYLHYCRTQSFHNEFSRMIAQVYPSWLIDSQDVHMVHTLKNLYGPILGVYSQAATDDELARAPGPMVWMIDYFMKDALLDHFGKKYSNVSYLIAFIQEGFCTKQLPKARVYNFLQTWIERQEISLVEKEELMEGLAEIPPRFMNRVVEEDGLIDRSIIAIMLWEMGILEPWPNQKEIDYDNFDF